MLRRCCRLRFVVLTLSRLWHKLRLKHRFNWLQTSPHSPPPCLSVLAMAVGAGPLAWHLQLG